MIKTKNKIVGTIKTKNVLQGVISPAELRIYPELEDLEITPSGVEQNFKSEKYGYDNVKVKAVESDTLEVIPKTEEQQIIGLFGIVNVNAVDNTIDSNIKPENIKQNVNILGVEGNVIELNGEEKIITPTIEEQIIFPSEDKNAITKVVVKAMVVPNEQWYIKESEKWI